MYTSAIGAGPAALARPVSHSKVSLHKGNLSLN